MLSKGQGRAGKLHVRALAIFLEGGKDRRERRGSCCFALERSFCMDVKPPPQKKRRRKKKKIHYFTVTLFLLSYSAETVAHSFTFIKLQTLIKCQFASNSRTRQPYNTVVWRTSGSSSFIRQRGRQSDSTRSLGNDRDVSQNKAFVVQIKWNACAPIPSIFFCVCVHVVEVKLPNQWIALAHLGKLYTAYMKIIIMWIHLRCFAFNECSDFGWTPVERVFCNSLKRHLGNVRATSLLIQALKPTWLQNDVHDVGHNEALVIPVKKVISFGPIACHRQL